MNIKDRGEVIAIGSLTFVMIFGNSMFVPVLPDMEVAWQLTSAQVGFVLTVFSLPAACMIPTVGYLIERYEKKKLTYAGLSFVLVGCIISFLSVYITDYFYAYMTLLGGRALQGIGVGVISPLPFLFAGEMFKMPQQTVVFSMLEVFNGVAKVVSPFVGILTITLGGNWLFIFYLLIAILSIGFISQMIPISPKGITKKTPISIRQYRGLLMKSIRSSLRYLSSVMLMGGLTMLFLFGLLSYFSYEIEWIYDMNGVRKAFYFSLPLLALTLSSWQTGKFLKGKEAKVDLYAVVSLSLMAIIFIVGMFHYTFIILLLLMIVFAIASGMFLVCCNLLVTKNVKQEERGTIMSFYSMIRFLGVAFGPPIFTMWMFDEILMFSFCLLLLATGWIFFYQKSKQRERQALVNA